MILSYRLQHLLRRTCPHSNLINQPPLMSALGVELDPPPIIHYVILSSTLLRSPRLSLIAQRVLSTFVCPGASTEAFVLPKGFIIV